jgi:hypothetical protein
MAKESSRELPPVRLPNPTAESFVASLKVVHFFAVFFFWLVLAALVFHLAAFCLFQAGLFDAVLKSEGSKETPAATTRGGETKPAATAAKAAESNPAPATATAGSATAPEARTDLVLPTVGTTPAALGDEEHWWTKERAKELLPDNNPYIRQLASTLRLVGLMCAVLLLITLFIYLEIALLGRLAGVRYLTLSFFMMLFCVATVYTWEPLLPGHRIIGSFFVLDDLVKEYARLLVSGNALSLNERVYYFVHFLVFPLLSFVLLIVSWLRFNRGYEESVLLNE